MISRVADHCFWFGRYLERAESTARVLAVTENLALDAELSAEQSWLPVVIVSGEHAHFTKKHGATAAADGEVVQDYMTWAEDNHTSILKSVTAARDNARSIREVVSLEGWETVNELYLWITSPQAKAEYKIHRYGFYRHVRRAVQLTLGLLRSTMLHDTPLDFIWLGVMLERLGQTARVLDVHHHAFTALPSRHQVVETALWLGLLRACSGFEPFMKRNPGRVTADAVAAFLILEPSFPRSIRYCLESAYDRFQHLRPPDQPRLPGADTALRLEALVTWLRLKDAEMLPRVGIHSILTHVVDETALICNGLGHELFGYPAPPKPVTVRPPPPSQSQTQSQGQG